jgi:hypothetical protein
MQVTTEDKQAFERIRTLREITMKKKKLAYLESSANRAAFFGKRYLHLARQLLWQHGYRC